jgi:conjugal transfer/entry exclusion protein
MIAKFIRYIGRPCRAALSPLALVMVIAAPNCEGAMTVFDPLNLAQNVQQVANEIKQLTAMGEQLGELQKSFQQLQDTYNTIQSTIGSMGLNLLTIDNQLKEISTSDMQAQIQQECGDLDPVGAALSFAGFDMNTDVRTQQRKVCQQIIETQTDKYNTAVRLLNNMTGYSSTLSNISDSFGKIAAFAAGDREALSYRTNEALSTMTMDMNNADQKMKADDATISALQTRQSQLAKVALRGSSSMIGDAMQAVIFTGAFSAN